MKPPGDRLELVDGVAVGFLKCAASGTSNGALAHHWLGTQERLGGASIGQSGLTSAPRFPHFWQTNLSSMSESAGHCGIRQGDMGVGPSSDPSG
jgi:hypothetical protein